MATRARQGTTKVVIESPSDVSIFRVPNFLKESTKRKRKIYVPKMVSFGPYHHTNAELNPMKSHKERARHGTTKVVIECAAPAVESDSDIDDEELPPQGVLRNGSEAPRWIDKAELTISIEGNSDFDRLRSPSDVSIFRVPNFLKESTKRKIYVPKMVSLGPYHHTNAELTPMMSHKERAVYRMMTRSMKVTDDDESNENDFFVMAERGILRLECEIKKMYEENINFKPDQSLTLLLIRDGCFILEILRTLGGENFPVTNASKYYEAIFERNRIDFTGLDILNDMLKLENQIPLIVLRMLLKLELNSTDIFVQDKLCKVLLKGPSSKFYPFKYDKGELPDDMGELPWPQPHEQIHHLLGLLHCLIVYGPQPVVETSPSNNDNSKNGVRRIPRALELKNVGIDFKPCKGFIKDIDFHQKNAILDFHQKNATIVLPRINITNHTEVLFRNLIALEVCKASSINYVTCYVSLMDELIDTGEDVALLRDKGIVTNYLGSDEEAAQLINGLLKGVTTSRKDTFEQLKQKVNAYYRTRFKVYFAEFVKEHCSSPWKAVALMAAILLLIFTVVQTVCSILQVV